MTLREDEIEALLKFDGSKLVVVRNTDLLGQAGQEFVAIITGKGKTFARGEDTRIRAVHAVWEVYSQYIEAPHADKDDGYWLYENAMGDVEVQLAKNQQEKHDG